MINYLNKAYPKVKFNCIVINVEKYGGLSNVAWEQKPVYLFENARYDFENLIITRKKPFPQSFQILSLSFGVSGEPSIEDCGQNTRCHTFVEYRKWYDDKDKEREGTVKVDTLESFLEYSIYEMLKIDKKYNKGLAESKIRDMNITPRTNYNFNRELLLSFWQKARKMEWGVWKVSSRVRDVIRDDLLPKHREFIAEHTEIADKLSQEFLAKYSNEVIISNEEIWVSEFKVKSVRLIPLHKRKLKTDLAAPRLPLYLFAGSYNSYNCNSGVDGYFKVVAESTDVNGIAKNWDIPESQFGFEHPLAKIIKVVTDKLSADFEAIKKEIEIIGKAVHR